MSRPKPPCKDCKEKHKSCYSECKKYKEFSEACLQFNLQMAKIKGHIISDRKKVDK